MTARSALTLHRPGLCETAKLEEVDPMVYLRVAVDRALADPGAVTLPQDLRG